MTDVSTDSLSGKYSTLLTEYVQKALIQWVCYNILPFINYKITNKSVSENSSNSQPTELDNIKFLRSEFRNKAEYYNDRIAAYIKENHTDFPEYYNSDCNDIKPSSDNFFGGFYLG